MQDEGEGSCSSLLGLRMPSEYVSIQLSRDNHGDSWGFTIAGGKDVDEPLSVQYVSVSELGFGCNSRTMRSSIREIGTDI